MTEGKRAHLLSLLRLGKGKVRSSHELSRLIGEPQKSIGFAVSALRQEGHAIGSVHGEGYYLIETVEELEETIAHISKRKAGIDRTIAALRSGFVA